MAKRTRIKLGAHERTVLLALLDSAQRIVDTLATRLPEPNVVAAASLLASGRANLAAAQARTEPGDLLKEQA